ncbi:hypothetical protein ANME2D_02063 [Candidatus Methanoperedens nitroreducens]|uniref:Uncharacterized protein n=1 Tax=Candidatus Methanoperedens nitratireducens TaxID=1392998 RepID=A0A062UWF1_9EURY|nr:hypothetical protein [Candidatus Methanoperedens nitroreducens]KCZ71336.1 hypothetical protein ANME2D_02063 [Candidatus Methanoperedens nitroreducens]MDJ1420965.1 hypothetical protein [Candidatus Methanoperedens sp.]
MSILTDALFFKTWCVTQRASKHKRESITDKTSENNNKMSLGLKSRHLNLLSNEENW